MYTIYNIENKKLLLQTFTFFREENFNKVQTNFLEGYELDNSGKIISSKLRIYINKDEKGYFFRYKTIKKYIHDYNYMTIDELIEKMKKEEITIEEFIATLIKEGNKAVIVENLPLIDKIDETITPEMQQVGCKIVDDKNKETKWYYKIATTPLDEEHQKEYGIQEYHISDLYSLIKNGYFKIESKKTLSKIKK